MAHKYTTQRNCNDSRTEGGGECQTQSSTSLSSPAKFVSISLLTTIAAPCHSQSTTTSQKCCIVHLRGWKVNTIIGHEWDELSPEHGGVRKKLKLSYSSPITRCSSSSDPRVSALARLFSLLYYVFHPYACLVRGMTLFSLLCFSEYARQLYVWKLKSIKMCNSWGSQGL